MLFYHFVLLSPLSIVSASAEGINIHIYLYLYFISVHWHQSGSHVVCSSVGSVSRTELQTLCLLSSGTALSVTSQGNIIPVRLLKEQCQWERPAQLNGYLCSHHRWRSCDLPSATTAAAAARICIGRVDCGRVHDAHDQNRLVQRSEGVSRHLTQVYYTSQFIDFNDDVVFELNL